MLRLFKFNVRTILYHSIESTDHFVLSAPQEFASKVGLTLNLARLLPFAQEVPQAQVTLMTDRNPHKGPRMWSHQIW